MVLLQVMRLILQTETVLTLLLPTIMFLPKNLLKQLPLFTPLNCAEQELHTCYRRKLKIQNSPVSLREASPKAGEAGRAKFKMTILLLRLFRRLRVWLLCLAQTERFLCMDLKPFMRPKE